MDDAEVDDAEVDDAEVDDAEVRVLDDAAVTAALDPNGAVRAGGLGAPR